eukprot:scaffold322153_cov22-Tisochrysis_lutea.AAC.1
MFWSQGAAIGLFGRFKARRLIWGLKFSTKCTRKDGAAGCFGVTEARIVIWGNLISIATESNTRKSMSDNSGQ